MSMPARPGRPLWIRVAGVVVLVAIWVALWGTPTLGNVLSGLVVVAVVFWLFPGGPGRLADEHEGTFRPIAAARYAVYFAGALVLATWDVALTVLSPRSRVAEAIVAVPLRSRSPVIATMVGNSITLTPGTMTIDVDDDGERTVLYVHVLNLSDAEEVRRDGRRFEGYAVRAFGSPADRDRWAAAEAAERADQEGRR